MKQGLVRQADFEICYAVYQLTYSYVTYILNVQNKAKQVLALLDEHFIGFEVS
jgi:hypothetical protein